jgi:hypothetical protein
MPPAKHPTFSFSRGISAIRALIFSFRASMSTGLQSATRAAAVSRQCGRGHVKEG